MWDNLEQAFGELDAGEYQFFATTLGSYRKALMAQGFTRREAARLVESYAKFVYDMVIEEVMSGSKDEPEDDVDPDEMNGLH